MEIKPDELIITTENPYQIFVNSLPNPATRHEYVNVLKKVACQYLKNILTGDKKLVEEQTHKPRPKKRYPGKIRAFADADFEVRINEFVRRAKSDPVWAESVVYTMVKKLRDRNNLPTTHAEYIKTTRIKNILKAIKKLFEINGVPVVWGRINGLITEENDIRDKSKGYSRQDIQKILRHCDPIESVMVYLAASSGIRAGAFNLRWEHILPIYKMSEYAIHQSNDDRGSENTIRYVWDPEEITETISDTCPIIAGMIRVYADSYAEYFAFITPECLDAIELYKQRWIKETNTIPKLRDIFFKKDGPFVLELGYGGIRRRMLRIVDRAGVRKKLEDSKKKYDIPLFNGFRRYFNKSNKKSLSHNSRLASLILKETMMGHSGLIKLDKNYFKEHIDELIEEYINAIPDLTINDTARKQAELEKERKEKSQLQKKVDEIEELKQRLTKKEQEDKERHESLLKLLKQEHQKGNSTISE